MHLYQQSDVSVFFNMLSRLVTAFLPRSKHLLISLHFSKQRLEKAAKGLDANNDHVCPKLGSLRWCLGHKMLIREFPWDRQLWEQEQEGQRSGCDSRQHLLSLGGNDLAFTQNLDQPLETGCPGERFPRKNWEGPHWRGISPPWE